MSDLTFTSPLTLEQLVKSISQLSFSEQKQLVTLVPTLHQAAIEVSPTSPIEAPPTCTLEQAQASLIRIQNELRARRTGPPLSADDPFLDGLTLGEYHALPEAEKARLWDKWGEIDWDALEEREVNRDALPAR